MRHDPVSYALHKIFSSAIPAPILEQAFVAYQSRFNRIQRNILSIDAIIRKDVFEDYVLMDLNLIGGNEHIVPLANLRPEIQTDTQYSLIYRIPKDLTNGRSIVGCIEVTYGMPGVGQQYGAAFTMGRNSNPMLAAASAMVRSHLPTPVPGTIQVQLIGDNVVLVNDSHMPMAGGYGFLRCRLEYDEAVSSLRPQYYLDFSELAIMATKAIIYNRLNVLIDKSTLVGGYELGAFRDIVSSYSDAHQNYREEMVRMHKLLRMNDKATVHRNITALIGGGN